LALAAPAAAQEPKPEDLKKHETTPGGQYQPELDVLEGEELITEEKALLHHAQSVEALRAVVRNNLLLQRDNVVFTPHNAFNSREALQRILDTTIANIQAWQRGESLHRVV
jgi:D-lactate dehydrogenase